MQDGLERAVFIDKDGTLIEDIPHNVDPARLRFTPYAVEALRLLASRGWRLIIVTHQPGIALQLFDEPALRHLQAALTEQLAQEGVVLDGFFFCPHASGLRSTCACRKPAPGLLHEAALRHRIDLDASWMIGDVLDDVEAGARAGCRTVLLDVGHETVWRSSCWREPSAIAPDLLGAARHIVAVETMTALVAL